MEKTDIVFLDNGRGRGGRQRFGRGLTEQRYNDDVLRHVAVPYVRRHRGMMLQHDVVTLDRMLLVRQLSSYVRLTLECLTIGQLYRLIQ